MQIRVQAESTGRHLPELASIWVSASHESNSQETSTRRATELVREVLRIVDERAPEDVVTEKVVTPTTTRSWTPTDPKGKPLPTRYTAQARVMVEVSDLQVLGALTTAWARIEGVELSPPSWRLAEQTRRELSDRVTREAIMEARNRAQVMAEASGFSTITPVLVADSGLMVNPMGQAMTLKRSMAFAAAGDESVDLAPPQVEVTVRVEAEFSAG